VKIKITIEDHGIQEAIDDLSERLVKSVGDAVGMALHQVEALGKANAPIRTGALRGSIRVQGPEGGAAGWTGKVGPHVIYANIQEFGGVIVPKRVRFLRWVDAGGEHFARKVTIPAHPYMRPALAEVKPDLSAIFNAELEKAIAD